LPQHEHIQDLLYTPTVICQTSERPSNKVEGFQKHLKYTLQQNKKEHKSNINFKTAKP
jgi:hypothetical protein